jgi:predicted DNA-binding WGR domain protein
LIDTPIQYEQVESLERDVLRPRLLHNFGWQVTSVLAKDWYENNQQEIDRLLTILAGDADDDDLDVEESAEAVSVMEIIDSSSVSSAGSNAVVPSADEELANLHSTKLQNIAADSLLPSTPVHNGDCVTDKVTRRFEYRKDLSSKFWEITVNGSEHTVRFGKIGKSGQTQTKRFVSSGAAQQDAARLIVEKQRKGYIEASD